MVSLSQLSCGPRAIAGSPIKRSAGRLASPLPAAPRRLASVRCRAGLITPQRAQLVAASTALAAAVRSSHVCGSTIKQAARDALDALDGAKARRLEAIDRLYHDLTREGMEAALAEDFSMSEMGHARKFGRGDYVGMMLTTLAAIPDFNWGAATTGDVADDGYCVVVVRASGHHTGGDLRLPGRDPLPPSGRHFCLAEEVHKLKVEHGKVKEILVLPNKGAGPSALYAALGGKPRTPEPAAAPAAAPAAGDAPLPMP